MSGKLNIKPGSTGDAIINPLGMGSIIMSGNIPYPKFYDIHDASIWTNKTSWADNGPARLSIVEDKVLLANYSSNSSNADFLSLELSDGTENWKSLLSSGGYPTFITADSSIDNYYWGDGYAAGQAGKTNSAFAQQWKVSKTGDQLRGRINKSGTMIYTLEGYGSTSGYPIRKLRASDGGEEWAVSLGTLGSSYIELDLDEEYLIVTGRSYIVRLDADGSTNWTYTNSNANTRYNRPAIDNDNAVYSTKYDGTAGVLTNKLIKLDGTNAMNLLWSIDLSTNSAADNYNRALGCVMADDGNVWVQLRVGVANSTATEYIRKYRASDGLFMESYQITTLASGLYIQSFKAIEETDDIIASLHDNTPSNYNEVGRYRLKPNKDNLI